MIGLGLRCHGQDAFHGDSSNAGQAFVEVECLMAPLFKVHLTDVAAALETVEGDFGGLGVGFVAGFGAGRALGDDGEHASAVGFKIAGGILSGSAVIHTGAGYLIQAADDVAAA